MENRYLFKAKRLDDGEWVVGYIARYGHTGKEKYYIIPNYASDLYSFLIEKNTICQCTGLKDKNNNLIWENDIIDRKAHHLEVVKYKDGDWTIDDSYACGKETGSGYSNLGFYAIERKSVEVIGNIFDNKELLESEEK